MAGHRQDLRRNRTGSQIWKPSFGTVENSLAARPSSPFRVSVTSFPGGRGGAARLSGEGGGVGMGLGPGNAAWGYVRACARMARHS